MYKVPRYRKIYYKYNSYKFFFKEDNLEKVIFYYFIIINYNLIINLIALYKLIYLIIYKRFLVKITIYKVNIS
jgi:hypothetical protein